MQRRQPSRRAAARNISPSTASIDTLSTPMSKFSSRQASNKSSPITSVTSEDESEPANISGGKRLRGAATGEVARDVAPPRKKRREVYVEVRRTKTGSLPATSSRASSASIAPGPLATEDENDEAILSDDELDPQEVDESDASGSEFEVSEAELLADEESDHVDSVDDVVHFSGGGKRRQQRKFASLSDEEDETMRQAVRDSIRMKSVRDRLPMSSGGAGPSTDSQHETHIDLSELSSLSDAPDSDHPLLAKKSGKMAKGKAKEKEKPTAVKTSKARKGCKEVGQELREMRKKLGRKLTHAERTTVALYKFHPELRTAWGDVKSDIPINVPVKATQPEGLKCTLLPFQLESLHWMRAQEGGIWAGGVLADEMGMGKTIQTIALFVADRKRPNLVIAPTVAIMQWKHEIEAFTEGFKVLIWHGAKREQDLKELQSHDVVLTTYAVLESTFRKQQSGFKRQGRIVKEKSALHQVSWNRIILDEAHNIKERSCNTAKAAFELKSSYKWCLSGTPLQNRVGELYSLIRFLGGDPFSYYFCKRCDCKSLHWKFSDKRSCDTCGCSPMMHTCFWNNEILTPIQKMGMSGAGETAFKKLKILLDRMMLRRTKVERADDLGLPPRVVIVRRDYFSPEEKELYLSLFSDAKRQFSTYLDSGTVLNNYSNIFSLITRMRQMACHPDLVLKSKTNAETWASASDGEGTVCRLCNDIAEDAIVSKCKHVFDRECIKQYLNTAIEQTPDCPVCHLPLTIDLEAPALEVTEDMRKSRQGILGRLDIDSWRSSTKIEALVEELSNLRRQDATTKSLVFSQFVNFLDLIAFRLQRAGFKVCRLEGTMSPQARDATIQHFMNNVEVTVFLVSLKAGGVALNLTEASRVYLMDSWWNPAVEFQAMDRIHRLGQHRPVQAIKLVVEDSIESRIVQLQEKKSAMVEATLSTDDAAMGRLTPQDLGFLFRL